ncbi:hypothetical protein GCM10009814_25830 [Lapillicoccus jejuensis]
MPSPRRPVVGTAALLCASLLTVLPAASGAAAALPAATPGALPAAAPTAVATATAAPSITVTGKGFGHGHGMSQWGAYGAATQGVTWQQIVTHYYPGTTLTPIGNPTIRVNVSSDLGQVAFGAAAGLRVTYGAAHTTLMGLPTTAADGSAVSAFVVASVGSGYAQLKYLSAKGAWTAWGPASPQVNITNASTGVVNAWGTVSGRVGAIPGELRGVVLSGRVVPVAAIPMEQYLRGVVPHESPASWPGAALGAQAVAARSYAAWQMAHPQSSAYDICDSTACQVYQARGYYGSTDAAIAATAGSALRYQGQPAFTQFSASTGGWNSAGGTPYLVAQPDPWDATAANPNDSWSTTVSASTMQARWPSIGTFQGLQVLSRDGAGTWGGRITSASVRGTAGSVTVSGDTLQAALGLRSTYFTTSGQRPDILGVSWSGGAGYAVGLRTVLGSSSYVQAGPVVTAALGGIDLTQWRFLPGRRTDGTHPDLIAVRTSGSSTGRMEVTTFTSASGYRTPTRAVTPFPAFTADASITVVAGANPGDVCLVVVGGTASRRTELHCLGVGTGYTGWTVHAATALSAGVALRASTFLVVPGTGDLVWVAQGAPTGSGQTELHRMTAASGWGGWGEHRVLPLGYTSSTSARFLLLPSGSSTPDLAFVPVSGTGSGRVEVHTLTGSSGYSAFDLHVATPIAAASYPGFTPLLG